MNYLVRAALVVILNIRLTQTKKTHTLQKKLQETLMPGVILNRTEVSEKNNSNDFPHSFQ